VHTPIDEGFMARAIELAARADYRTHPNPKVGALVVRDGVVLGEGFHARAGGPHAEVEAVRAAREAGHVTEGATLYVSLEPCGHFPGKRTPPCVELALSAGFARVVVGQTDPNPAVAGSSLAKLREAGVALDVGVLDRAARLLNQPFTKWMSAGTPYVTAKWAMSLDGKIAAHTGDSQWISGPDSRRSVHVLRGEVDAVAVGIGTALADDPSLTRRDAPGRDPLRVVLDSRARLPLHSALVQSATEQPLLVVTTGAAPVAAVRALEAAGAAVVRVDADAAGHVEPAAALRALAERDVRHLLVEGGGELLAGLFEARAVDRVVTFVAPSVIGGEQAPGPVRGRGVERVADAITLEETRTTPSGSDVRVEGLVRVW
jgi:diaminohydroxyphosphoribosylaminopyrimidine deaminase/5-amino-6-(5-phosphoribosylamino)uracil reductase